MESINGIDEPIFRAEIDSRLIEWRLRDLWTQWGKEKWDELRE